ncbi:hypothetical protein Esti_001889 [Eimeria stiedai]
MEPFCRELMIKRKVVERDLKDLIFYRKEALEHQQVLQQMEASGREPSDIRQRRNVLTETLVMIPDAEGRLAAACTDLGLCISGNSAHCMHALAFLLQQGDAADAAPAAAEAAAAAAQTNCNEVDLELVKELAAARAALRSVRKEAPQLPLPLEIFDPPTGGDDDPSQRAEESPEEEI